MTILATVIVLGVLIFVHELGHFWAAKAVGVEVQCFSIGFGPKVLGFKYGETEYVLSLLPLGGYVKMGGMDDEVMERLEGGTEVTREPSDRDFDSKSIWARTLVISAGVIMNMLFAFGVYTFVIAKWGVPELSTTRMGLVRAETLPSRYRGTRLDHAREPLRQFRGDAGRGLGGRKGGTLVLCSRPPRGAVCRTIRNGPDPNSYG